MTEFFSSQSDMVGSPDAGWTDRGGTSARSLATLPEAV
jgi:hypothetical protein